LDTGFSYCIPHQDGVDLFRPIPQTNTMKTPSFINAGKGGWILSLLLLVSLFAGAQNIDFGKSYINVSKGLNGGTLETGDTLEIRAAFVVRSGTYDSCSYTDLIPAGTSYIPGTVRVLTNEGKIYKQFTDAINDDEGWINGSTIRINLGYNQASGPARSFRRGRVANSDRPSFYGSTCIMIASFRIKITAAIGSTISTGGGSMTYKSGSSAIQTYTFPANTVAIYTNYGICSNSVGANSLGTEFNGTFGSGRTRNRGTSANVPPSYTYNVFTGNSPNDYYYGIANNTSAINSYTTSNSWAKPDNSVPTHRVFSVWDIIGDHTNAANSALGNTATDTVAIRNGGYMLVINASYRIDSAFQQTISNLCPNTYYEISCWMRNICSKCGCDSAGRGSSTAGYIPTAPGDTSGVYPNITFEVDGVDYFTTGNIMYTGNWIKKGFTFLTGPSQTSFTLKFFNNAPGGGGNDWALDDISVATCSPNLAFTPSNQPTVCKGNVVDFGSYIRSYFNNYTFYKWQSSNDNGSTWTDAGISGTATPAWNGSAWEYFTSFPTFVANMSDSGRKYRVVVATTASNLSSTSCSFSETGSILTLNVIDCGVPLETDFLAFNSWLDHDRNYLRWTTSKEESRVQYSIEKSTDGQNYLSVATLDGAATSDEKNYYGWDEPGRGEAFYRIRMQLDSRQKFSRVIRVGSRVKGFDVIRVPNPVESPVVAFVQMNETKPVLLELMDYSGRIIQQKEFNPLPGLQKLELPAINLSAGVYLLRIRSADQTYTIKVLK
jgi:hypothetical protein